MPGRRPIKRRTPRRKKNPTTKQLAKKIHRMEATQELKWKDYQLNLANITALGFTVSEFLFVNEGTGFSERVGSKIQPTSLQMKLMVRTALNRIGASKFRIIVFWDRQTNGASPVLVGQDNGVLDNSVIGTAPMSFLYCPINYLTRERYHVIYDKIYTMNPKTFAQLTTPDVTETLSLETVIRKNFKLSRILKYDSAMGTLGDLVSNSLHVGFISDDVATGSEPEVEGSFRMYFKDL